jgi:hypothetical protein
MAVKLKTGRSARVYHTQQVHYLHKTFAAAELPSTLITHPGVISVGVLPANCLPLETYIRVNTAFSSGDILIGTSAAGSSAVVCSTVDLLSGTTGTYVVDRYMGTYSTSDVPLYIQTATSGQSSAGVADVWVAYLPVLPST